MKHAFASHPGPLILLHGGASPIDPRRARAKSAVQSLARIARRALRILTSGGEPVHVASYCCWHMEKDPLFNAGLGSALQADGGARLSAALMVGAEQRFSGVINASYVEHPIELCVALQQRQARALSPPGTELLARELGLEVTVPATVERGKAWLKRLELGLEPGAERRRPKDQGSANDTVGCLVRSAEGVLVAAASTGGRGFEMPGRVSDTCTVAGTYASPFAAVVATGIGEQIVDDALASRLETRVRDGMTLSEASERCFREARERRHQYGWLALGHGQWCAAHTTPSMPYVVVGQGGRGVSLLASSSRD